MVLFQKEPFKFGNPKGFKSDVFLNFREEYLKIDGWYRPNWFKLWQFNICSCFNINSINHGFVHPRWQRISMDFSYWSGDHVYRSQGSSRLLPGDLGVDKLPEWSKITAVLHVIQRNNDLIQVMSISTGPSPRFSYLGVQLLVAMYIHFLKVTTWPWK